MKAVYYLIFRMGYLLFKMNGTTWWKAYVAFRRLFVITKGGSNDDMSEKLSREYPPQKLGTMSGVLGDIDETKVKAIVEQIDRDGYYIFDINLPQEKISKLLDLSLSLEAQLIPAAIDGTKVTRYNSTAVLSPRYQFREQEILSNRLVQEISFDRSLFAVAQGYLRCLPIQDLTAMWWSAAFTKKASSEAAQLYHFDMDRFKFIKFFFYLTDVDTSNGPHCYIKGSHKQMPDKVWKDGRLTDEEVQANFPKEDIKEIVGKKGSIIAVDTRGLHKGKVLDKGERLILQIEYTNSLFGAPYERVDLRTHLQNDIKEVIRINKHSYQRFSI